MVSAYSMSHPSRGLFAHGDDFYALLGVPLTASPEVIKRAYRRIAMTLRQGLVGYDSGGQGATTIFAKLVNPAKTRLTRPADKEVYDSTLDLLSRKLTRSPGLGEALLPDHPQIRILYASTDLDADYTRLVEKLSDHLYESTDLLLEQLDTLSEANLAYLLLRAGAKPKHQDPSNVTPITSKQRASSTVSTAPPTQLSPVETPHQRAQTHYQEAVKLRKRDLLFDALEHLRLATDLDPMDPSYHMERARIYRQQSNLKKARVEYNSVMQLDPYNIEAEQGLRDIERHLKPPSPPKPTPLASPKQPPQSQSTGPQSTGPQSTGPQSLGSQSAGSQPVGSQPARFQSANSQSTKSPSTNPQSKVTPPADLQAKIEESRNSKAEEAYQQALDALNRGMQNRAIEHLDVAIREASGNRDYYLTRARIYRMLNSMELARADYEAVLEQDPYNVEALQGVRDVQHLSVPAVVTTKVAREEAQRWYLKATEMLENADYKKVLQYLAMAIEKDPRNISFYLKRAEVQRRLKNKGMARADYKRALQIDPTNKQALKGLKATQVVTEPQQPVPAEPEPESPVIAKLFKMNPFGNKNSK